VGSALRSSTAFGVVETMISNIMTAGQYLVL
jgi:hypothetical protein